MKTEDFKFKLSGRTLAIIDWANVYGWFSNPNSITYLGWEIDLQKLFDYLSGYKEIHDQRFYFGVETSKEWSKKLHNNAEAIGFNVQSKEVKWVPVSLDKSHFKKLVKELFDVLDGVKNTNSSIAEKLYELREKIKSRLADVEPDFGSDGKINDVYPLYAPEDQKIYDSAYDLIEELDEELRKLNIGIDELQGHLSLPIKRRKCDFDVEIARDAFNLSNDFETLILFSGDGDYAALAEDLIAKGKKVVVVFAPGHKGREYDSLKKGIFLCSVNQLKNVISREKNIPKDCSEGRDSGIVANNDKIVNSDLSTS